MSSTSSLINELNLEPSELRKLSGPSVWPSLSAEQACDRFIQRRPELRYLLSRQRQDIRRRASRSGIATEVRVTVYQVGVRSSASKRRMETVIGHFTHTIDAKSMEGDVKVFLVSLRNYLRRRMPDNPTFGGGVRLQFKCPDKGHLADFREEWL